MERGELGLRQRVDEGNPAYARRGGLAGVRPIAGVRKPRFWSVVETLAEPMINLQRLATGVKKPVRVGF